MAVTLAKKGSKISLAKAASDAGAASFTKLTVGLHWDSQKYDGADDFDLDASCFLCGDDGKVHDAEKNFVFYNNLTAPGVTHTGDNRTGDAEGDDEVIEIDLTAVEPDITKIAIAVTIFEADTRHQNFGQVSNAGLHVMDATTGVDIIKFDLEEDQSCETAVVMCEFYRHNGEWKFNAVGAGWEGGLAALCNNYGIDVE